MVRCRKALLLEHILSYILLCLGLQGKQGPKKREQREKKARRAHKTMGKVGLVLGKKKEVVFNEEARTDWLSGFQKRKQQRRMYGLTMQVLKDKKSILDMRKERRKAFSSEQSNEGFADDNMNQIDDSCENTVETHFDDDTTKNMFGGEVSVVIDTGIVDRLEENANPDLNEVRTPNRPQKKGKSRFDTAAVKAKEKMRHRPGRSGGKHRIKRSAKTQLLHKALGSGVYIEYFTNLLKPQWTCRHGFMSSTDYSLESLSSCINLLEFCHHVSTNNNNFLRMLLQSICSYTFFKLVYAPSCRGILLLMNSYAISSAIISLPNQPSWQMPLLFKSESRTQTTKTTSP
eukprot:gene5309-10620_t